MKIWQSVAAIFLAANMTFAANYHTEEQRATIGSLQRVDKNGYLYEVNYKGDYKLDEILATNPVNPENLQESIHNVLLPKSSSSYKSLPTSFACTAISAMNPEDHPLLGHNYDMLKDERAALIVHTAPPEKYASVGVADMGFLGMQKDGFISSVEGQEVLLYAPFYVMSGVNEKGFSITTLWLPGISKSVDTGLTKIYSGLIPRYMLDNARSVQDALEKFSKLDVKMAFADKKCAFHWLLNDAYGDSAVVEFVNNQFIAQPKAFTAKHQVAANYWVTPMEKINGENGFSRTKMIEKNFNKTKYPTNQQVLDWLLLAVPEKDKELLKIKNGSLNLTTVWTVVYDLAKRTGEIYMREDQYHKYGFGVNYK